MFATNPLRKLNHPKFVLHLLTHAPTSQTRFGKAIPDFNLGVSTNGISAVDAIHQIPSQRWPSVARWLENELRKSTIRADKIYLPKGALWHGPLEFENSSLGSSKTALRWLFPGTRGLFSSTVGLFWGPRRFFSSSKGTCQNEHFGR